MKKREGFFCNFASTDVDGSDRLDCTVPLAKIHNNYQPTSRHWFETHLYVITCASLFFKLPKTHWKRLLKDYSELLNPKENLSLEVS